MRRDRVRRKRDEVGRHAPGKATVRGAGARGAAGGLAGWALYVTLGAVLSAGTCAAAQFGANGPATRANREIGPTPLEAPIDATMARIARFEKVPGFDPAHLSAASRNLFSLADRWAAVRERLLKGAAAPAEPEQSRAPGSLASSLALGHRPPALALLGFHPEPDGDRLVRSQCGYGIQ